MSPYQRNVKNYLEVQVSTSSKEKLLLMVYEGTIKFLKTAKMLMEKDQADRALMYIFKANTAIVELVATLDHNAAPEIAGALQRLYLYMIKRIKDSVDTKTISGIDETINLLDELRKSWEEAFAANNQPGALEKTG